MWTELMINYIKKEVHYLDQSAEYIANKYRENIKNLVLSKFYDPDHEENYAICKMSKLELECLVLKDSRLLWFEISNTLERERQNEEVLVKQIFLPNSEDNEYSLKYKVLSWWLENEIKNLDYDLYLRILKKNRMRFYFIQVVIILFVSILWICAYFFSP